MPAQVILAACLFVCLFDKSVFVLNLSCFYFLVCLVVLFLLYKY